MRMRVGLGVGWQLLVVCSSTAPCTALQRQKTPLLLASMYGGTEAVQVLVNSKADIEARNEVSMWQRHGIQSGYAGKGLHDRGTRAQEGCMRGPMRRPTLAYSRVVEGWVC